MILRNALVLTAVLPLSACFTIIDFDLDGGAGGAGAMAATPATGTGAGGGQPTAGGGGGGGEGAGGNPIAPPCDEWCDTACIAGACQPMLYFEADQYINVVGVGGPQLVIVELGVFSPEEPADMKFLPADALEQVPSPTITISSAPSGPWNAAGSLAVDPQTGNAFYSPQGAMTANPMLECSPASGACALAFGVPAVGPQQSHLNGVTFFDGKVFGISPVTGRVWMSSPSGSQASVAFDVVMGSRGEPIPAGHSLAFGANRVVVSSLGPPASGQPCVGIGSEELLVETGDQLVCAPLPASNLNVSSLAVGRDGDVYYRVVLNGDPLKGVTLRDLDGTVETPFHQFELVVPDLSSTIGGVLVDSYHVYFFAGDNDLHLMRCDVGGGNESCVQTSASLVLPGAMAANDQYLFFASGSQLFRVAKPPPPP